MNRYTHIIYVLLLIITFNSCKTSEQKEEWIDLFNGKDLSGWQANETPESFKVVDGIIVANGLRSHLLYTGEVANANFKNFELSLDVMTYPLANSGVYFHTAHQKEGWLNKGYEMQINTSHRGAGDYKEVKKAGSLYGIRNVYKAFTRDSVWSHFHLRVAGKHIQIKIDDKLIVDYIEPNNPVRKQPGDKILSSGTFALQGHDPESTVFFKNIRVKLLDDNIGADDTVANETGGKMIIHQADHVPFIDMNISTDEQFDIEKAIKAFHKTGVNLGLLTDVSKLNSETKETDLEKHLQTYEKYPVFIGIAANNPEDLNGISAGILSRFDYTLADFAQFKNAKGKVIDLLSDDAVTNKEAFMNDYVNAIVSELNKGRINIWAKATRLPKSLEADYDKLWTKERMSKVIDAAKNNGVAIEVNNELKIPSIDFLKMAKEKGCLFSGGDIYVDHEMADPDYFLQVIDACKLVYKDIYIPGNPNEVAK